MSSIRRKLVMSCMSTFISPHVSQYYASIPPSIGVFIYVFLTCLIISWFSCASFLSRRLLLFWTKFIYVDHISSFSRASYLSRKLSPFWTEFIYFDHISCILSVTKVITTLNWIYLFLITSHNKSHIIILNITIL